MNVWIAVSGTVWLGEGDEVEKKIRALRPTSCEKVRDRPGCVWKSLWLRDMPGWLERVGRVRHETLKPEKKAASEVCGTCILWQGGGREVAET